MESRSQHRADGSLDVDDDVLAELDWVVASIHTAFDRARPSASSARSSPHVDSIGHLTGRKILKRAGTDVDIERIVVRAAETGTALEINSQPDRLDLRDTHARLAGEAGVQIPITTDAQRSRRSRMRKLSVGLARRAWLTKEQILNTRTWPQIQKLRKAQAPCPGSSPVEGFGGTEEFPTLAGDSPSRGRCRRPRLGRVLSRSRARATGTLPG